MFILSFVQFPFTYLPSRAAVLASSLLTAASVHRMHSCLVPSCAAATVAVHVVPVHDDTSTDAARMDCIPSGGGNSPSGPARDPEGTLSYYYVLESTLAADALQLSPAAVAAAPGADARAAPAPRRQLSIATVAVVAAAAALAVACLTVQSMACNISAVPIANCAATPAPR